MIIHGSTPLGWATKTYDAASGELVAGRLCRVDTDTGDAIEMDRNGRRTFYPGKIRVELPEGWESMCCPFCRSYRITDVGEVLFCDDCGGRS